MYPNGTKIKNVDFTPFRGRFPALFFPGSSGIRVSSGEIRGTKKRPRGPMSRTVRSYLSLLLRNGKVILLFRGKMGAMYQQQLFVLVICKLYLTFFVSVLFEKRDHFISITSFILALLISVAKMLPLVFFIFQDFDNPETHDI